jgi:hypothetical protein
MNFLKSMILSLIIKLKNFVRKLKVYTPGIGPSKSMIYKYSHSYIDLISILTLSGASHTDKCSVLSTCQRL